MSIPLRYDMPGAAQRAGIGDSITQILGSLMRLDDSAGHFSPGMVGGSVTIAGAADPNHNGVFTISLHMSSSQICYNNPAAPATEAVFIGTWTIDFMVPGGCLLAYDAAEVEDDELMLSGPHTGVGGSVPPAGYPNPGPNEKWEGPYGPEIVDWTNGTHPGADMTQGGWSPPNQSLKYDSSIPAGWYTRTSRRNRYARRDVEVATINDP